jgi:hypothetical protein
MRLGGGGIPAALALLDLPDHRYAVAHDIIQTAARQQGDLIAGVVRALLAPWRKR